MAIAFLVECAKVDGHIRTIGQQPSVVERCAQPPLVCKAGSSQRAQELQLAGAIALLDLQSTGSVSKALDKEQRPPQQALRRCGCTYASRVISELPMVRRPPSSGPAVPAVQGGMLQKVATLRTPAVKHWIMSQNEPFGSGAVALLVACPRANCKASIISVGNH